MVLSFVAVREKIKNMMYLMLGTIFILHPSVMTAIPNSKTKSASSQAPTTETNSVEITTIHDTESLLVNGVPNGSHINSYGEDGDIW